MYYFCYCLAN